MPAGTNPTRVDWTGSTGAVSVYYNPTVFGTQNIFTTGNGRFDLASASQLTSFMLVNTAATLSSAAVNPAGTYALGRDIDAGGATIPGAPGTFTGILDGRNAVTGAIHKISNVVVAGPALIGTNSGIIRDLKWRTCRSRRARPTSASPFSPAPTPAPARSAT